MPSAGQVIRALDFSTAATDSESASGTTTSTSFTATLTGGTACEVTFVAPTSGKVCIVNTGSLVNSGANETQMGFRIGTGSTPGAGTEVLAASVDRSLRNTGTNRISATFEWFVTGLTAGSTYNVQQQFAVAAGTGTFLRKQLTVVPVNG